MKNQIVKTGLLAAAIFMSSCCRFPDLGVEDLVVTWTDTEQRVSFKVKNYETYAAGPFMVYVNLNEDPVSPNHRPQYRERVNGLAGGGVFEVTDLDLSFLAHLDNNYLGNVYEITVEVDPKNEVTECDETNNTKTVAVAGISMGCRFETEFENVPLGTQYNTVNTTFMSDNVELKTIQFIWAGGNPSTSGYVEIDDDQNAGGTGQDLWINNMNVELVIPDTVTYISFDAGYYGGNMNLEINGQFHNVSSISGINTASVGGVTIHATGSQNNPGLWEFTGPMISFYVGGQEFWIDNVCMK